MPPAGMPRALATLRRGRVGVIHGTRTYVLQDEDGQIAETHSVSAGLDYAAVGPEHAMLRDAERAFYTSATDEEALAAFSLLMQDRRGSSRPWSRLTPWRR